MYSSCLGPFLSLTQDGVTPVKLHSAAASIISALAGVVPEVSKE